MRWPFRRRSRTRTRYRTGVPSRVSSRHNPMRQAIAQLAQEFPDLPGFTASGTLVRHGQAAYLRRLIMPWQIRAFGYYDLLGEVKYSAQFYSRALANLILFAAEKNEEGDLVPTEEKDVVDAFERIKDPGGGGRSGLLADYGRLMFLVGEALLFVSINRDTDLEQWEMLSTDELRLLDGNYTRFMAPVLPAMLFQPAPDDAFVPVEAGDGQNQGPAGTGTAAAYRLWRRHPRFSSLPDATMEGALDICEELVLLTQVVRARARSRLATAGILFIDERVTTRPDEPTPDEDVLEDPFLADMTEAFTAPITDEGTASAVVPMLARVKVPQGMKLADLVYHLQVVDPMQVYPETGLRMECIKRLAIVLDMPPEVLLGVATVNHWGAWMIDEQSWKVHLQPVAQQLVEDLTSAYLQPYLREQGVQNWEKYFIDYDASKVINHPDRTSDALRLHERAIIGDDAVLDAAGFDADDKPTKEELARIVGMAVRDPSLAWYGEPSIKAGGVEVAPGEIVSPQAGGEIGTPQAGARTGGDVEAGPPPGGPPDPGDESVVGAAILAAEIQGAAQFALLRAREAAGARLRTLARREDEIVELIEGKRNRDVAPLLGRARVRTLLGGPREAALVAGARELVVDALRVFGVEDEDVVALVVETIERHAARTLYDATVEPLPDTFPGYVTGLLASAAAKNGG